MQLIKAANGNINSRHGESIGRASPHVGIDIGWGGGLALFAPADGFMSWGDSGGTYGNRAIIQHPDNTWSLIAHAATFFVNDRSVVQGQHIGTMGRTGGPWGSIAGWFVHAHQEYHLADGSAVDPLAYMGSTPAGRKPAPLPEPIIDESTEDDMNNTGLSWTRSSDGRELCALTNTTSGYWSEWETGGGAYNTRMAQGFRTESFVPVTESHANNLRASALAVSAGK